MHGQACVQNTYTHKVKKAQFKRRIIWLSKETESFPTLQKQWALRLLGESAQYRGKLRHQEEVEAPMD